MFVKSNPKGMALLLHSLLCLFDNEEYRPRFTAGCWFPYTMVEMKEFKSVALEIVSELVSQGRLGPGIVTKAVLETASGVKMW